MLSFFPRDVLDEILDLIESVSEGFITYFYIILARKRIVDTDVVNDVKSTRQSVITRVVI